MIQQLMVQIYFREGKFCLYVKRCTGAVQFVGEAAVTTSTESTEGKRIHSNGLAIDGCKAEIRI